MAMPAADPVPGTLLVASALTPPDPIFGRTVVLIVDREPNGITTGFALNRPLDQAVTCTSALALLFITDPSARAFWGGPMGTDPAILAQLTASDGLDYFHLPFEQRRPFPLPDVGVIAVAEHTAPFEGRILQARLYIGLCAWGRGQLEAELARGDWHTRPAVVEDIFTTTPERLWDALDIAR
jgi:putative transcriptional regulator